MAEFKSWQSYLRFVNTVRYRSRFVFDEETREFLATVVETAEDRVFEVDAGSILLRAQLGSELVPDDPSDEDSPGQELGLPPERMKPIPGKSRDGRANAAGITYLYLSDDAKTAMAEMRPWIGVPISVGQFQITRNLRVVDCSREHKGIVLFGAEPNPEKRREAVWRDIDSAFARPVSRDEDPADYVPTQILTDQFRAAGFDGVMHRSSVGHGKNFILFNIDDATLTSCGLYEAKFIEYDFRQRGNPYVLRKGEQHE